MDAVEFLKEWKRMCSMNTVGEPFGTCCMGRCPLLKIREERTDSCRSTILNNINESVKIVEQWSKEHPRKTRLQDFLEKHPNAIMLDVGHPDILPRYLGYCGKKICTDCEHGKYPGNKNCWNLPLEE